ncbi:MAG: universal stress protein [Solirubrobacteraceae bacterium]|nr:universal stress protein [Solirubrobacteraceae bacterium]
MGSTIVCAFDLAEDASPRPLDVGLDLAERLGRPLVVAHVAAPDFAAAGAPPPSTQDVVVGPAPSVPYPYPHLATAELEAMRDEARRCVERLLARRGMDTARVEVALDVSVADGLRRIAADNDAELLIVGSRGRGAVRAALLGSTSHALAGDAPCPVVVVPASD